MAEEVMGTSAPQDSPAQAVEQTQAPTMEQNAPAEPQAPAPTKVKVKHLHEEKELTIDEAVPYIQKGMDYDRVKSQYEEAAEDRKFVERLAKKYGMDAKTLKSELEAAAEQQRVQEFTSKGVPEDIAKEIVEAREFREQIREKETRAQSEARKAKEAADFLEAYPGVDPNSIPPDVWKDVNAGIPLVNAYAIHDNASLRARLAEMEKRLGVEAKNQESAAASTGSMSGAAPSVPGYISEEALQRMSSQEIAKNWDKVEASMKHWGKK